LKEFRVGEKVVYPAHGVGVIENVESRNLSGAEAKFYTLRILDTDMKIMIPTAKGGVRRAAASDRQRHGEQGLQGLA
jgi:RNA polymerase-interacting CarD/CdnL/TRCF family regulator